MKRYIVSQFGRPRGLPGRLVGGLMARKNRVRNDWAISLLNVQRDDHILEVGFGPGAAIQQVAGIAEEGFIAGIDLSETMVQQASRRNAPAIRDGRVELKQGCVSNPSYRDGAFDKVFAINSIMFWPEPVEGLKALRRALKPGGMVAIMQQPRWAKTEDMVREIGEEMATQLSEAGFRKVRLMSRPMKPVTCLCALGVK